MTRTNTETKPEAFPMPDCCECGRADNGWTTCEITATSMTLCIDCQSDDVAFHEKHREQTKGAN